MIHSITPMLTSKYTLTQSVSQSINRFLSIFMSLPLCTCFLPVGTLLQQSKEALCAGLECFQCVNDRVNQALVHNNLGRLMLLYAKSYRHLHPNTQFTKYERQHYIKVRPIFVERCLHIFTWSADFFRYWIESIYLKSTLPMYILYTQQTCYYSTVWILKKKYYITLLIHVYNIMFNYLIIVGMFEVSWKELILMWQFNSIKKLL